MKRLILCVIVGFLLSLSYRDAQAQYIPISKIAASRSEVVTQHGMVAAVQPLAAQIGLQILKNSGNAVDAAIAVDAALGVMSPAKAGVGGDLFAIVWSAKDHKLYGLNASGPTPQGRSYKEMQQELKKREISKIPRRGILPITVPGCVSGWFQLHKRFGSLPMKKILAPAIKYAEEGFPVSKMIAHKWKHNVQDIKPLHLPGAFMKVFTINGRAPREGEIFKNRALVYTYTLIANKGRSAFYKGKIAHKIVSFLQQHGGYMQLKDFAFYHSRWVKPLSVNYRGYQVYELPPNTQGITVLEMLQILEGYNLSRMGFGSVKTLHLMIEAKKLAFEDRAKWVTDPNFANIPIKKLISKKYTNKRRKLIGKYASKKLSSGIRILKNGEGDTVYLTVADDEGNMVSLINSNFNEFGSGVVVPGLGFALQDRGELFSMDPKHINVYAHGKRPFHTLIPGFVTKNGKPFLSFGVMGGSMQPQGQVQILTDIIDFGMDVQEAGDAPRWRHFGSTSPTDSLSAHLQNGGAVILEPSFPVSVLLGLRKLGYRVHYRLAHGIGYGGYQAIMKKSGVYYGASESRQDGEVVGY